MSAPLTPEIVARAFHAACLAELEALKPGNVHRFGDGHGMSVADFERSAEAAAPFIGEAGSSVGRRIRRAVEATNAVAGHNTNLGIILLCATLAGAALAPGDGDLRQRLSRVLADLGIEDAREAYAAIRLAKAGGLGKAAQHDLGSEPAVTLLEAMREAEQRDRIAWNYTHNFEDIFDRGLPRLARGRARFGLQNWAVTDLYLSFLADKPDTLIARKSGLNAAEQVSENASKILSNWEACERPEAMLDTLMDYDKALKAQGLNPGTTADLTVATLFASSLLATEIHP